MSITMKLSSVLALGLIKNTFAACSNICPGGFEPTLSNFEIPDANGLTCATMASAVSIADEMAPECTSFMGIQGFCCPRCFICGSQEADNTMENPGSVLIPEKALTCQYMANIYGYMSYAQECPTDPADLDTSAFDIDGIAVGFELRGFCGCKGFSAPDQPVCALCSEGKVVNNTASFVQGVMPGLDFTCKQGADVARHINAEPTCIIDSKNRDACCIDAELAERDAGPAITTQSAKTSGSGSVKVSSLFLVTGIVGYTMLF